MIPGPNQESFAGDEGPAYAQIVALIKARSGIALGSGKRYLLETRLQTMMQREGCTGLDALAAKLQRNTLLAQEAAEALTTNESLFFRDRKPFDALRDHVLPRLATARGAGSTLRIWSAAASTGQEAYSIAMTAADLGPRLAGTRVEILGTDLSREVLIRAREGLYSQFEVQRGLPMQMLVKHFAKDGPLWRIKPELRARVSFREWNLLDDPASLGRFDVIFCRNVLIYFDEATKIRVLTQLARQLAPDGLIFLGGAETLLGLDVKLQHCPPSGGYVVSAPKGMAA